VETEHATAVPHGWLAATTETVDEHLVSPSTHAERPIAGFPLPLLPLGVIRRELMGPLADRAQLSAVAARSWGWPHPRHEALNFQAPHRHGNGTQACHLGSTKRAAQCTKHPETDSDW